jgi:hypothetical protein
VITLDDNGAVMFAFDSAELTPAPSSACKAWWPS